LRKRRRSLSFGEKECSLDPNGIETEIRGQKKPKENEFTDWMGKKEGTSSRKKGGVSTMGIERRREAEGSTPVVKTRQNGEEKKEFAWRGGGKGVAQGDGVPKAGTGAHRGSHHQKKPQNPKGQAFKGFRWG